MTSIPINLKQGTLQSKDTTIVGIDLGTTNSLIAVMDSQTNRPVILKKNETSALTPSVVHFDDTDAVVVGVEAKKKILDEPKRTISSIKRLMGKSYQEVGGVENDWGYTIIDYDEDKLVRVQVGEKYYTPIELSAFILQDLKNTAEEILGKVVSKAVITVPAYFNDTQRQAVKDAGKLAGLEVLRIVNEPTAAGLAYGMGTKLQDNKTIAVYDLGGGTFDISILRITGSIFEVLATKGDTHLGGDDCDIAIANHWKKKYGLTSSIAHLKVWAEEAKKVLSLQEHFLSQEQIEGVHLALDVATMQGLISPWIDRTIAICQDALQDGNINRQDIDHIIMVGGSTRSPLVREAVARFFGKEVDCSVNPDEVVALGAAVQADILAGNNKELLLLDVTPLSLGIETIGGLMDVLVTRNTTIPTQSNRTYTTQKDGQVNMRISIFQGERELVADNRKLGEFTLKGIPPMPAGIPKIKVSFFIDADGILKVYAKEETSGVEQEILVKPQYGLMDKEIELLLRSSLEHAKEDMTKRAEIEAKVEAQQLLEVTRQFLNKNKELLSPSEIEETNAVMARLEQSLDTHREEIFKHIDQLNQITQPFAERLMNRAIQNSLRGKAVD